MACCIVPDLSVCRQGPCCPTATTPVDDALQAIATELALSYLWAATGRRFARTCKPITVRPCKPETCKPNSVSDIIWFEANRANGSPNSLGILSYEPTLVDGSMFNIGCGCKQGCCTCKSDCEVFLPGPICEILDVTLDGIPRGANLYTVYVDSVGREYLSFRNHGVTVVTDTPGPTFAPDFSLAVPQATSSAGCGVSLDTLGANYGIQLGAGHPDVMWEMEFPIGGSHTFSVFQPQNFTVEPLDGNPDITVVGSTVTVGPAKEPNTAPKVRLKAPKGSSNVDFISITPTAGSPPRVCRIQWSDLNSTECGVSQWATSEKAGRLIATAAPNDLDDRWSYFPSSTGGTNRTQYGPNTWGPTTTFDAYYNTFPALPGGVLQFEYDPDSAPEAIAIAPVLDPANPSAAYEWSLASYPNGTVLGVGDSIVTSTISDPDVDDGSRYKLTVTSGTATTVSARAMDLSVDFAATVEFQERKITNGWGKAGYCCPPCQDYNKPAGEEGTWSVTYTLGEKWPTGSEAIAGLLACEFGNELAGNGGNLPDYVTSLVRQGISIDLPDPFELIKLGLTGIRIVDRWIRSQNPLGLTQRARVWSPDLPVTRREI